MSLYEEILKKNEKVSLVGLGYVGMPIAVKKESIQQMKLETKRLQNALLSSLQMKQNCVRQNFILSQYRLRLTLTIHRILHQSREQVMLWDEILPKDLL